MALSRLPHAWESPRWQQVEPATPPRSRGTPPRGSGSLTPIGSGSDAEMWPRAVALERALVEHEKAELRDEVVLVRNQGREQLLAEKLSSLQQRRQSEAKVRALRTQLRNTQAQAAAQAAALRAAEEQLRDLTHEHKHVSSVKAEMERAASAAMAAHAEDDAQRQAEAASRKARLSTMDALLKENLEDDRHREARLVELERLIEEDRQADAVREQLIGELRTAHAAATAVHEATTAAHREELASLRAEVAKSSRRAGTSIAQSWRIAAVNARELSSLRAEVEKSRSTAGGFVAQSWKIVELKEKHRTSESEKEKYRAEADALRSRLEQSQSAHAKLVQAKENLARSTAASSADDAERAADAAKRKARIAGMDVLLTQTDPGDGLREARIAELQALIEEDKRADASREKLIVELRAARSSAEASRAEAATQAASLRQELRRAKAEHEAVKQAKDDLLRAAQTAATADEIEDAKRFAASSARKAQLAQMDARWEQDEQDDRLRERRVAQLEQLIQEDKKADAEREKLIGKLRVAHATVSSEHKAAAEVHAAELQALRRKLDESQAAHDKLARAKLELERSSAAAFAADAEEDAKRAAEAAERKVKLADMDRRLKDDEHDDAAREAKLAELERLIEEDKRADAKREQLIVELRKAQVVTEAEHKATRSELEQEVEVLKIRLRTAQDERAKLSEAKEELWRTTEAALAVDMAQDVQRAEEAATRKVRLKQMENTLQSEQHDDAARDARLAELERLMEDDKQADAEREELIVELRAAQVVASAEHSAERTQLEREIKDLRAELAGQALIATAPIDDVSKAKRVEKAVAARHTEHAEEDARRSEETAARKGKLAEIEALLEQEEQDDQEREARIAELLRVIEEDKVADAQREDFIVELRVAHATATAEHEITQEELEAEISSLRAKLLEKVHSDPEPRPRMPALVQPVEQQQPEPIDPRPKLVQRTDAETDRPVLQQTPEDRYMQDDHGSPKADLVEDDDLRTKSGGHADPDPNAKLPIDNATDKDSERSGSDSDDHNRSDETGSAKTKDEKKGEPADASDDEDGDSDNTSEKRQKNKKSTSKRDHNDQSEEEGDDHDKGSGDEEHDGDGAHVDSKGTKEKKTNSRGPDEGSDDGGSSEDTAEESEGRQDRDDKAGEKDPKRKPKTQSKEPEPEEESRPSPEPKHEDSGNENGDVKEEDSDDDVNEEVVATVEALVAVVEKGEAVQPPAEPELESAPEPEPKPEELEPVPEQEPELEPEPETEPEPEPEPEPEEVEPEPEDEEGRFIARYGAEATELIFELRKRRERVLNTSTVADHWEDNWALGQGAPMGDNRDNDGEALVKKLIQALRDAGFGMGDNVFTDLEFPAESASIYMQDGVRAASDLEPFTADDIGQLEWKRPMQIGQPDVKSVVFSDGIDVNDIQQGSLRDCYWLAALASCAVDSDDDLINDLIIEDGADLGLYGVKLFVNGRWITFLLDDWFPCRAAGGGEETRQWSPAFCSFSKHATEKHGDKELWSMLLEKAFAKLHGSYEAIGIGSGHNDGVTADAVNYLTGGLVYEVDLDAGTDQATVLPVPGTSGVGVMVSGSPWDQLVSLAPIDKLDYTAFCSTAVSSRADAADAAAKGLETDHAYSLLGVKELASGEKLVRLRNPYGTKEWTGSYSDADDHWTDATRAELPAETLVQADDGAFWMGWEDFRSFFAKVGCCNPFALLDTSTLFGKVKVGRVVLCDTVRGSWVAEKSAGGKIGISTFEHNPHFKLVVGLPTDRVETRAFITMYQEDVRSAGGASSRPWLHSHLYLTGGPAGEERKEAILNLSGRQCYAEVMLKGGVEYTLTAAAWGAGVEGTFWITASARNCTLTPELANVEQQPDEEDTATMALETSRVPLCLVCKKPCDGPTMQQRYDVDEGCVHATGGCFEQFKSQSSE